MQLSIVLPVRNPDALLNQCLKSLARIESLAFETIIVLDHDHHDAPDLSQLAELSAANARVVVPLERPFAGGARNRGIREAKGEYIAFMDADDTVDPALFAKLIREAEQGGHDMVTSGFQVLNDNDGSLAPGFRYAKAEVLTANLINEFIARYPNPAKRILPAFWGKVFRREVFDQRPDPFPAISLYDDMVAIIRILGIVTSLRLSTLADYHYRIRPGTISRSFSRDHVDWALHAQFDLIYPLLYGEKSTVSVDKKDYYRFLHQQARDFMSSLCQRSADEETFHDNYQYLLNRMRDSVQAGKFDPFDALAHVEREQWLELLDANRQLTQWHRVRESLAYRAFSSLRRSIRRLKP